MPTPRAKFAGCVAKGTLIAVRGRRGSPRDNLLGTVESYDQTSNVWAAKAPMPTARNSFAIGVVNGILYAVGGGGSGSNVADAWLSRVEAYDPSTNRWTAKAPMPTPRAGLGVGVV